MQLPTSISARRATIADRHSPRSRLVTRGCQQQNSLTLPTAIRRHLHTTPVIVANASERRTAIIGVKTTDTDRNR